MVVCVNSQQYGTMRPMPLGACAMVYWNDLGLNKGDLCTRLIGHQTRDHDSHTSSTYMPHSGESCLKVRRTYHGYVIRWMHQSAVGTNGRDLWEGLGQLLSH